MVPKNAEKYFLRSFSGYCVNVLFSMNKHVFSQERLQKMKMELFLILYLIFLFVTKTKKHIEMPINPILNKTLGQTSANRGEKVILCKNNPSLLIRRSISA